MSDTITVRLPRELAAWLERAARAAGLAKGTIVRQQLERAKAATNERPYLHLAGTIAGPKNLSSRKGFSRS